MHEILEHMENGKVFEYQQKIDRQSINTPQLSNREGIQEVDRDKEENKENEIGASPLGMDIIQSSRSD